MADNVAITAGSGTVIAADEVSRNSITEKQQIIKISFGVDGSFEGLVSSTTPLPVGGTTAQCIGKAEDAAHTSGDVGVPSLGVRQDTAAALSSATGDYSVQAVNSYGATIIDIHASFQASAALGILKLEDTAHASGDAGVMSLGVRNDNDTALSGTDGDYTPLATDQSGRIKINPGTSASSLGKAEDAAHGSGDTGVMMLGVRNDAYTTWTTASGDYSPIAVNQYGALLVDIQWQNSTNGAASILKLEDAASASGDAGVMALTVRKDTPTSLAGSDGDYAAMQLTLEGGLWVTETPSARGGLSRYRNLDLGAGGVNIKASVGKVYKVVAFNKSTSPRYLKLYDKATAPTVGTDTPVDTYPIEGAATAGNYKMTQILLEPGSTFAAGIGIACTTALADADIGAPSANDVVVQVYYK